MIWKSRVFTAAVWYCVSCNREMLYRMFFDLNKKRILNSKGNCSDGNVCIPIVFLKNKKTVFSPWVSHSDQWELPLGDLDAGRQVCTMNRSAAHPSHSTCWPSHPRAPDTWSLWGGNPGTARSAGGLWKASCLGGWPWDTPRSRTPHRSRMSSQHSAEGPAHRTDTEPGQRGTTWLFVQDRLAHGESRWESWVHSGRLSGSGQWCSAGSRCVWVPLGLSGWGRWHSDTSDTERRWWTELAHWGCSGIPGFGGHSWNKGCERRVREAGPQKALDRLDRSALTPVFPFSGKTRQKCWRNPGKPISYL